MVHIDCMRNAINYNYKHTLILRPSNPCLSITNTVGSHHALKSSCRHAIFVRLQSTFIYISKHSKFNLANNNTPNLTQLTSMTWKTCTSTTKKGRGTTLEKFNFNASSIKCSGGFLKSNRGFQQKPL